MPYEEVDYWNELCEIFEFAKTHVYSNMFICWGAQASLYYHYGIDKHLLEKKVFGVFEHKVVRPHNPLVRGFDETFYAPHSRHTEVLRSDIEACDKLRILADSPEVGPHIIATENGRQIFVLGHQEYDKGTLAGEYFREMWIRDSGISGWYSGYRGSPGNGLHTWPDSCLGNGSRSDRDRAKSKQEL